MDREDIKEITSLDGEVGYMPFKTLVCNVFMSLYHLLGLPMPSSKSLVRATELICFFVKKKGRVIEMRGTWVEKPKKHKLHSRLTTHYFY